MQGPWGKNNGKDMTLNINFTFKCLEVRGDILDFIFLKILLQINARAWRDDLIWVHILSPWLNRNMEPKKNRQTITVPSLLIFRLNFIEGLLSVQLWFLNHSFSQQLWLTGCQVTIGCTNGDRRLNCSHWTLSNGCKISGHESLCLKDRKILC